MRGVPKFRLGQQDGVALAALVLLAFSLLFGGASRQHELRLSLVELAALPLLVLALRGLLKRDDLPAHRFGLGLAAAAAALPLVQLIPLPPAVWMALPGREQLVLALEITGIPVGWVPLTFTPDKTWSSFLALLPPLAMFLGLLMMHGGSRLRLAYFVLGATLVSILLGAAQLASGGDQLHPWATTDAGNVAGFFANRNHLATLCLIGIPFATVLGSAALRRGGSRLPLWLAILYVALTVVALGVIRSRAGVILFAPVLGASLLAAWVAAGRGRPRPLLLGLIGGAAVAFAAVGAFAAAPLLARFDPGGAPEGRFENWPIVAEAAEAHLPLGSGLGSFDAVYRSVEPLERLDPTYFNQAHNDYLETWLEAGWIGAALIIAFLVWFGRRSWTAWRAGVSTQRDLQRAATIAIGAVLLHSAVDYPLRTAALATVFALCCGLLELAVRADAELSAERRRSRRAR
ncbi:MAG TPA: O-antigen ligase family protein [Caulobacteraceae bacterium]|nr:O-antigen ligase family protein [Caulobacteraceae bacterium]